MRTLLFLLILGAASGFDLWLIRRDSPAIGKPTVIQPPNCTSSGICIAPQQD